jgi:hypothetical protein
MGRGTEHTRGQGPHIDFRIAPELYPPILNVSTERILLGTGFRKFLAEKAVTAGGYDPFGNRIQIGHRFDPAVIGLT